MESYEPTHFSLRDNGALNPDKWEPHKLSLRSSSKFGTPNEGDLVAWRYGVWRVHQIRPIDDVDLTEEQQEKLTESVQFFTGSKQSDRREMYRPFHIVLRHHSGPLATKDGEAPAFKRLHDGTREVSVTSWPGKKAWPILSNPYLTCSCHGHVWPCQDVDRAEMAAYEAQRAEKFMATTEPGVCAHCLELITTRQRTLTFPEPSRFVPGAPGPTYHAGRAACWAAAEQYERKGRLADNPDVVRLASCSGIRFIHEAREMPSDRRIECTAGPFCSGQHGPAGYQREAPCWHRIDLVANTGGFARPELDCGYRGANGPCLGADTSSGGTSISPTAADILWERSNRRRQ